MKKIIYILLLFSFSRQLLGQANLVPNPSFETYTSCPFSSGELTKAIGWTNPSSWGTPDYYNACSSGVGVPKAGGAGFQYAKSGNAFSGIYGYSKAVTNAREYVQTKLSSTLTINKCYYIGFYLNQANWAGVGSNNTAVYLSSSAISGTGPLLSYSAQIKAFYNTPVIDTLAWHLISGVLQSNGMEQYLTVGNFNNDSSTDTLTYNSSAASPSSYYYIDSVFVIPIDSMPGGMPAFAGNNVTINSGDSTFIGQQISNLNCTWYNGTVQIATNTSGLYVKPTVTTTYVVQQTLCGNTTTASVIVTVNPLNIDELGLKGSEFQISPNPNNGLINFEINNKEFVLNQSVIKIYDMLSREVKEISLQSKKQTLDFQDLKNGIYYLQLHQNKNIVLTKKIIKQ